MSERPVAVYGPSGGQVRLNSADYGQHPVIVTDDVTPGRYPFPSVHNNQPGRKTLVNVFFEQRGQQDVPVAGYKFYGRVVEVPADPCNDWFLLPQDPAVMAAHPKWFQLPPLESQATVKALRTNGQMLEHVDGTPFTVIGKTMFGLFARYANGEDIAPVLQQLKTIGFDWVRVWTLFDIPGIGTLLNCPYYKIPAFVALCNAYGLHVELTAYTGINDPSHWGNLCAAALQCEMKPVMDYVNELSANLRESDPQGRFIDADADADGLGAPYIVADGVTYHHEKVEGLLCSHGSNGSQSWPVWPYWDVLFFHTNDADEEQRKAGHNAMEIANDKPVVTDETSRCPDRANNPEFFYDMGGGAALLCAGIVFHSVHGKLGQQLDDAEAACATALVGGCKSVNLSHQHDGYGRDEPPTPFLRKYYRGPEHFNIRILPRTV